MSKAWATGKDESETLPLLLGTNSSGEPTPAVESAVFIGDDGRIYVGANASRQYRLNAGRGRRVYENIKRLLSDAEIGSNPYDWKLEPEIDPTGSGLSRGDLLVLYLAWLTSRGLEVLADIVKRSDLAITSGADLRSVRRRFAIPCFEDTYNDGSGKSRATWARDFMRESLLRAQVLADTLTGRWEQLTVGQLAPLMKELRELDVAALKPLFAEDAAVREPVAAGASRFLSGGLREGGPDPRRPLLLVVDAGAGTTDFAMFQVATHGDEGVGYALIRNSVRMSTIAGNTADSALKPLLLEACGINPKTGAPRSDDDFTFIRHDLDARIRDFKETLVRDGSIDVALRMNAAGRLSRG
ncbi:MAG: hypothetical protein ACREFO_10620, partial [Acetobacteraceae bacterium]